MHPQGAVSSPVRAVARLWRTALTLLFAVPAAGCAPDFAMRPPPGPVAHYAVTRIKTEITADTPRYPVAGPFAGWLPVQRDAARQLRAAIVRDLSRRIRVTGAPGRGTLVVRIKYVDISMHRRVMDRLPFLIPDDDPSPRPVRATVLGRLILEDARGRPRATFPLDIYTLVSHRLNGNGAVAAALRQLSRRTLAELNDDLTRFSAAQGP